ncbi:ABC transporter permease [uncultured Shewanella sp.]|uniref:ABC transporter permease n=1 Tax=Shewanella atlantica TaxID=271099 RepID=UPI002615B490|nr:ABC transporter permease [uncultured Shewanella sp.]
MSLSNPFRLRSRSLLSTGLRLALQLILVVLLAYLLLAFSPLDPINSYLNGNLFGISAEQKAALISSLGLDQSVAQRMWHWFFELVQGNLGFSQLYQQSVLDIIKERLPLSLLLIGLSWICSLFLGYGFGLLAGLYRGGWPDRFIRNGAWLVASVPSFWLGMLLISLFSVALSLTPVCCAAPLGMQFGEQSLLSMGHHLILPVLTLTLVHMAPIVLHTREKVIDVLESDFVEYSRLHGDSNASVLRYHVIKNSLLPAVVLHFASFAELFGGSILAETVFNFPGLGATLVKAGLANDTALLMGCTLISAVLVFIGNLTANGLARSLLPGERR